MTPGGPLEGVSCSLKVTTQPHRGDSASPSLPPSDPPTPPFSYFLGEFQGFFISGNLELVAPKCSHVPEESDFLLPPSSLQIMKS